MNKYSFRQSKRRMVFGIFILLLCLFLAVGSILAYFSDTLFVDKTVSSGTLNLSAAYTYALNGTATTGDIDNLSPGDAVTMTATITNAGNMSAWVREIIAFTTEDDLFFDYLEVYEGAFTRAEILAGDADEYLLGDPADGAVASSARVLNGTGEDAQVESGEDGFVYIGSNQYSATYTVYFRPQATNELQNSSFTARLTTQALQFANNNTAPPSDTAWLAVEPAV